MFTAYEQLVCDKCKKEFVGRKPSGEETICPTCLADVASPVLKKNDEVPASMIEEVIGGRGDDE